MTSSRTNFVEIEKTFIRERILPEFDWTTFGAPSQVNELAKKRSEWVVALVGTSGAHLPSQPEFDVRNKRGDDSYREIPDSARAKELKLSHPGYDTKKASQDPNCIFPIDRLRELADEGVIGSFSRRAFSFMGYVPFPKNLMEVRAPEVADKLREDGVDLVILVPG